MNVSVLEVMVIDDDPFFLNTMGGLIPHVPGWHCKYLISDPLKALYIIRNEPIDVIILDIDMPELDGFCFMECISERFKVRNLLEMPLSVIMCSGYAPNPEKLFNHAISYFLNKSVTLERLIRAAHIINEKRAEIGLAAVEKDIAFRSGGKFYRIDKDDIVFLEVLDVYTTIYLVDNRTVRVKLPLSRLETFLPPNRFVRIHESRIIAFRYVVFEANGMVYMKGYEDKPLKLGGGRRLNAYKEWKRKKELK